MLRDWPVSTSKYPSKINNKNNQGINPPSIYPLGIHPMCFFTSLPCPDSYNKLRKNAFKRGETNTNNRVNKRELKSRMEKANVEEIEIQAVPVEQQEEEENEDLKQNNEKVFEIKEEEKVNEVPAEEEINEENKIKDEDMEEKLVNQEEMIDNEIKDNKIEEEIQKEIRTKKFLKSLKVGCPLRISILCRGQNRLLELSD
uniref:Uncharacterized protein n=1 Tax=Meloidogyne enterolobii TaxID=390850 RepID=A0A6V7XT07_MELEN|nr:unnamed protein product [Meloidogyne enterolobii]